LQQAFTLLTVVTYRLASLGIEVNRTKCDKSERVYSKIWSPHSFKIISYMIFHTSSILITLVKTGPLQRS